MRRCDRSARLARSSILTPPTHPRGPRPGGLWMPKTMPPGDIHGSRLRRGVALRSCRKCMRRDVAGRTGGRLLVVGNCGDLGLDRGSGMPSRRPYYGRAVPLLLMRPVIFCCEDSEGRAGGEELPHGGGCSGRLPGQTVTFAEVGARPRPDPRASWPGGPGSTGRAGLQSKQPGSIGDVERVSPSITGKDERMCALCSVAVAPAASDPDGAESCA